MLTGTVVKYNSKSELIHQDGKQFFEVIRAGAFKESIALNNITFNYRHIDFAEYGDTASKTLTLEDTPEALNFILAMPAYAATLRSQIEQGLIKGMSFGFYPEAIEQVDPQTRAIVKGNLVHVSAVYNPAYSSSSIARQQIPLNAKAKAKLKLSHI